MRTYILSTLNSIRQYSKTLDAKAILYNKNWEVFNDSGKKEILIFRPKNELLIVRQGIVQCSKWELLSMGALLIETDTATYLFNAAFVDNNFLALQLDGTDECMLMIESNYMKTLMLDSIDKIEMYLETSYFIKTEVSKEPSSTDEIDDDKTFDFMYSVLFLGLSIFLGFLISFLLI